MELWEVLMKGMPLIMELWLLLQVLYNIKQLEKRQKCKIVGLHKDLELMKFMYLGDLNETFILNDKNCIISIESLI